MALLDTCTPCILRAVCASMWTGDPTGMHAPSHRIHTDYHTVPSASAATWPLLERRRLWCPVPMALKPGVQNSAGGCQMNEPVVGACAVTVSDGAVPGSLGYPFFGGAAFGALAYTLLGGCGVPCVLLFRSPSSSRGSWIAMRYRSVPSTSACCSVCLFRICFMTDFKQHKTESQVFT